MLVPFGGDLIESTLPNGAVELRSGVPTDDTTETP